MVNVFFLYILLHEKNFMCNFASRKQKQSNKQQTDPWSVPVENATWKKKNNFKCFCEKSVVFCKIYVVLCWFQRFSQNRLLKKVFFGRFDKEISFSRR